MFIFHIGVNTPLWRSGDDRMMCLEQAASSVKLYILILWVLHASLLNSCKQRGHGR